MYPNITPPDARMGSEAGRRLFRTRQTQKGARKMFARCVTIHLKPDMVIDFQQIFETSILPSLRRRQGFQDELVLIAPDRREVIGISLWDNRQNADAYAQQSYPEIQQLLARVMDRLPDVQSYEAPIATFYKMTARSGRGMVG